VTQPKTKLNDASVDDFIAAVEDESRRNDCKDVIRMMRAATGAAPNMWGSSMVGFGSYHYVYASGREGDWMLCGFSPRKSNLTIYIMPGFESYGNLMKKIGKYATGKSCLYIRNLDDVDHEVLEELIRTSVKDMRAKYETKP
jgi:hypothetical protein